MKDLWRHILTLGIPALVEAARKRMPRRKRDFPLKKARQEKDKT